MTLPKHWASPEDFATLFQYFWLRDFPIGPNATGAARADWTIHIGLVVRSIADLMGLVTRFERGGRKDAILRSGLGDEIAVEWEWQGVWENELGKLKAHETWNNTKGPKRHLKYGVLISYTHQENLGRVYEHVSVKWKGAKCPLLLILVIVEDNKRFSSGKEFKVMHSCLFTKDGKPEFLRETPAVPWKVESTRWQI